jgi:uncharacterized protein (TIGR00730 family)
MSATTPRPFSVCVYCGSRAGTDPAHLEAATGLGAAIGSRGWRLIYGGGRVGLMGAVADAALAAGATVIGVIPESLMRLEVGHRGLDELLVVKTMHERKQAMAERADAFVALPGGIGTFEELFEVWTWRQLGYHDKPVGILNAGGYYDKLLAFLQSTVEHGFMNDWQMGLVRVGTDAPALLRELVQASGAQRGATNLSEI